MFSLGEKIALGISAVEIAVIGIGLKNIGNQYLDKYNMTAKEYVDAVMESTSINDYNERVKIIKQ